MTYDNWKTTNPADEWLGPEPDDDLDIPEFLKISQADRAKAWSTYKPVLTPSMIQQREVERLRAEHKREQTKARIADLKARKKERDEFRALPKSKRRWNVTTSQWETE